MHDYYAFGLEASDPTQDAQPTRFTSQETDLQNTSGQTDDLVNMHARFYRPALARFLSADLLSGNPHSPQSFNLFAYVRGNPTNFWDPYGLDDTRATFYGDTTVVSSALLDYGPFSGEITVYGDAPSFTYFDYQVLFGGFDYFTWGLGGVGGYRGLHPAAAPAPKCKEPSTHTCVGRARILQGNPNTIGRQGGFWGVTVAAGSAAVDPAQWGGKSQVRKYASGISGQIAGGWGFSGVTEVIGGHSPIRGMNVRDALRSIYPGLLILELPSAPRDLGIRNVTLTLPIGQPCPAGTREAP